MTEKILSGGPLFREFTQIRRVYHYSEDIVARLSFFYGVFRAIKMIDALRKPTKNLAVRVNTMRTSPEKVIDDLRRTGIHAYPSKIFREIIFVKIDGPFKVKEVNKKIIVKDKSAEGVMLGANLYAPGVLEISDNIKIGDEVNIITRFGEVIAYGISQISSEEKIVKGLVVEVKESLYKMPNLKTLRPFIVGEAYPASIVATEAIKWLNPTAGERILCISPSAEDLVYIIQLTGGNADITVISKTDLEELKIKEVLRKMKLDKFERMIRWHAVDYKYLRFDPESFDVAFVTPRSSKIGLRPRISAFLKEEDILALSRDAKRLLDKVIPAIRKGGRLLYAVPSLDPAEGEFIVSYLINEWNLRPIVRDYKWGATGIKEILGGEKTLRTYPDIHDDIGFFAALLLKD